MNKEGGIKSKKLEPLIMDIPTNEHFLNTVEPLKENPP